MYYTPKEGFTFNPLKPYRNLPCPCQSGKKIKRCHGQSELVSEAEAKASRAYLRRLSMYGLIQVRVSEVAE